MNEESSIDEIEEGFIKINDELCYKYTPVSGVSWIKEKLKNNEEIEIKRVFYISNQEIINIDESRDFVIIKVGQLENDYYKIDKIILDTSFDVFFEKNTDFNIDLFKYSGFKKSIFKSMNEVLSNKSELYIGGKKADISLRNFKYIIKQFPKKYEQDLYIDSRIHQVLENEINGLKDCNKKFELFREKNNYTVNREEIFDEINQYEIEKYENILKHLKIMLKDQELYTEYQWQKEIIKILFLIFPKYVLFLREVKINVISESSKKTNEKIDFMLVNYTGNMDIIEIKKPFNNKIISSSTDRDNYFPSRILSKTVMQVEKYIYHLNRWGQQAEKVLNAKYKEQLPDGITIKNINPKGMIIMGDAQKYSEKEIKDLEIIKKMYSNIIDVITYDDLILRLENVISGMKKNNI